MNRHFGCRVRDILEHGRRVLVLENEIVRVEILPSQGSEITSFLHKPSDTDVIWHRSAAPDPASAGLAGAGQSDSVAFLDTYSGGWQECLPSGGPGTDLHGAPIPFHGEVARLPWSVTVATDSPDVVSVILDVATVRTPLQLSKRLTLRRGRGVLEIEETLRNRAQEPIEMMWGHHPAFGAPFLDDSCRIDTSATRGSTRRGEPMPTSRLEFAADFDWPVAPLLAGGERDLRHTLARGDRSAEWVCLSDFGETAWYAITNRSKHVGFGLTWDASLFPYLWYWQLWGGAPGYPWFGREYCCALEPWTSTPDGLEAVIDNGTALVLPGEATVETRLNAVVYSGIDTVSRITAEGDVT